MLVCRYASEIVSQAAEAGAMRFQSIIKLTPGSWAQKRVQSFVECVGPREEVVTAYIAKLLQRASFSRAMQVDTLQLVQKLVNVDLRRWGQEYGGARDGVDVEWQAVTDRNVLSIWAKERLNVILSECPTANAKGVLEVVMACLQSGEEGDEGEEC